MLWLAVTVLKVDEMTKTRDLPSAEEPFDWDPKPNGMKCWKIHLRSGPQTEQGAAYCILLPSCNWLCWTRRDLIFNNQTIAASYISANSDFHWFSKINHQLLPHFLIHFESPANLLYHFFGSDLFFHLTSFGGRRAAPALDRFGAHPAGHRRLHRRRDLRADGRRGAHRGALGALAKRLRTAGLWVGSCELQLLSC